MILCKLCLWPFSVSFDKMSNLPEVVEVMPKFIVREHFLGLFLYNYLLAFM